MHVEAKTLATRRRHEVKTRDDASAEEFGGGKLWFLSLAAAMGGFLFGYDTAVINGGEQQIQSVWSLSSLMHGLVMSAALWGTVIGAMTGGKICDRFGRKPTLFGVGVLYLLSAVWSAFAGGPYSLMLARFIGGVGVGVGVGVGSGGSFSSGGSSCSARVFFLPSSRWRRCSFFIIPRGGGFFRSVRSIISVTFTARGAVR